jgi:histidinol phosphatase-like enzyme (inositol monophosphatase family)
VKADKDLGVNARWTPKSNNEAMPFEREVEFLKSICAESAALALEYQRTGISAETKDDDSPVTAADKACEKLLVEAISRQFPDDGILGEEGASKESKNGRRWIIDPIDGTRDYVRGLPFWAVLIGLEEGGVVVAGAAHCPAQGVMAWASKGGGSFVNNVPAHVSTVSDPAQAVLCFNGFHKANVAAMGQPLLDWVGKFWAVRGLGGAMDALLVAMGKADVWVEPNAKPWDFAALKLIVEEAGGRFSSFQGENSIYHGNGYACTPGVESFVKELFVRI